MRPNGHPLVAPRLNRRGALFVLSEIDDILAWERDTERDTRFVELGRYFCGVRSGQYWRLERLASFYQFLEKRFPECLRKAYYLIAIHEYLTNVPKQELKEVGWTKATDLAKVARREGSVLRVQSGCTRPAPCRRGNSSGRWSGT